MTRARCMLIAGIVILAASAGPLAHAYWSSSSAPGGSGQAVAATLPRAATPAVSAAGPAVSITWPAAAFSGASLGYEVLRYASSGGAPAGSPVILPCSPSTLPGGDLACADDPAPAGTYHYSVRTALNAWRGPESAPSAAVDVFNDTVPPNTTATATPSAPASGWFGTVPVTIGLTAIDDAGGSGVAAIRFTLDGSDPRSSATSSPYTTPIELSSSATLRFAARDAANNWETPASYPVRIDTQPPSGSLSLTAATGAVLNGGTLFYRGVAGGSFAFANAVTDTGGSGPASSTTVALAGTSTGWTHAAGTTTTPAGGPFVSATFTWAAGTTSAPTETVTSTDAAGNSSSQVVAFANDSTAPTVTATPAPAPGPGGWNNTAVVLALTAADNAGGSGVAAIRYTTDGSSPLTSGTAQTYSGPINLSATATVRFAALDAVGNASGVGSYAAQIDTTAPVNSLTLTGVTGGAFLSGSTLFYRGAAGGSFAFANAVADADSGAASSTTALGGVTTGWAHTPSTVTKRTQGAYVSNPFSWSAGTTSGPVATVEGADAAGNSSQSAITFVDDSAAPAGTIAFPSAAAYGSGSGWNAGCGTPAAGDVCGSGSDGGAGLSSVSIVLTRASDGKCWNPASGRFQPSACAGVAPTAIDPATGTWLAAFPCSADSFTLDVTLADNVGNAMTLPRRAWQVTGCAG